MWPLTRRLGLTRTSTRAWPVPVVQMAEAMGRDREGDYKNGRIRVCSQDRLVQIMGTEYAFDLDPPPVRDYLRRLILHEVQHALDDVSGILDHDHDRAFKKRLIRLEFMFPATGA